MKLLLLPCLLAAASACMEDSLIINGLLNGRFTYSGHIPPRFSAKSHSVIAGVSPSHESAGLKNHGVSEIERHNYVNGFIASKESNSQHSSGGYNGLNEFNELNLVGGPNSPNAFNGVDGITLQSSKEVTRIDESGHAGNVDESGNSGAYPVAREETGEFESSGDFAGGKAIWKRHHPLLNGLRNVIPYLRGLGHHRQHWNWIHPTHHYPGNAIFEKGFLSRGTTVDVGPLHIVSVGQYGSVGAGGPVVEKVTKVETQSEVNPLFGKQVKNIKEGSIESGYQQGQQGLKYGKNPHMNWNDIQYQTGQNIGADYLSGLDRAQYLSGQNFADHHSGYPISSTHQYPGNVITGKKIISKETTVDVGPHQTESFAEEVSKLKTHSGRIVTNIKEVSSSQPGSNQIDANGNRHKIVPVVGSSAKVEETEFSLPSYQQAQQFPFEDEESALRYLLSSRNNEERYLSGFDQGQYLLEHNQAGPYLAGTYYTGVGRTPFPAELLAGSSDEEKDEDGYFQSGLGQQEAGSVEDEISFADGQLNIFQHPSFIGSQFLQPIPGYVDQYQGFGGLVPYPYPYSLPVPVTPEEYEEAIYPVGATPVGGLIANIDVVEELGNPVPLEHHHNHHLHHEDHQHGPIDDVTIFSRFEEVDNEAYASAPVANNSIDPSSQQNFSTPAVSDVNLETGVNGNHSEQYQVNEHEVGGSHEHERETEEHHGHEEDGEQHHGNEENDGHHQEYVNGHPEEDKEGGGHHETELNNTKVYTSDNKEYEHQALDSTPRNQSDKENEIDSSGSETLVKRTTVIEDPRVVTLTIKIPPKTTTKEVEVTKSSDGFENKSSAQEHIVASENDGKVQVSVSDSQSTDQGKKEINIDSIGKILDLIPH